MKLVFSRPTCPIHSITTKNQIWVCISCFGRLQNRPENGPCRCIKCTGSCADYETYVFAPNMSNPLQYNQKPNLGMYLRFWSPSKTDAKTCPVGAINASVRASITKLVFSRQTCPTHTTTPKNQVWVCIASFGHLQKLRENAARWCIQRTRSCADYETCVFAQTCRIHSIPPKNQARVLSPVLVSRP